MFKDKVNIFQVCLTAYLAQIDAELFWEYKIINICGIWDKYTQLMEMAELENETQYKKSPLLIRFKRFYKKLGAEICMLFPTAIEDFSLLKKCRDNTAHGQNFFLSHKVFEEYYQALRRMRLMTIVFIYCKLGIPVVTIYKGIRHSLHNCVLNAGLDKFLLSSIIGDTPQFKVDSMTWSFLLRPIAYPCLKYDVQDRLLKIDVETTELAFDRSLKGNEKIYHSYIKQSNLEYPHPVMLLSLFIQYEEFHRELCGAFVLNYNELPTDVRSVCECQRCNMEQIRAAEE